MEIMNLGNGKVEDLTQTITFRNGDTAEIHVRQYLPVQEKLTLISEVLDWSINAQPIEARSGYLNSLQLQMYTDLALVAHYTDIEIPEDSRITAYDWLVINGVLDQVLGAIPESEKKIVSDHIFATGNSIVKYFDSIIGVLDMIDRNYDKFNVESNDFIKKLAEGSDFTFLKQVMDKLG